MNIFYTCMYMYLCMNSVTSDLQCLCSVQQVGEVKVHNVVPSDDIGIHFLDKVTPFLKGVKRRRRRRRKGEGSRGKKGRQATHSYSDCSFTQIISYASNLCNYSIPQFLDFILPAFCHYAHIIFKFTNML